MIFSHKSIGKGWDAQGIVRWEIEFSFFDDQFFVLQIKDNQSGHPFLLSFSLLFLFPSPSPSLSHLWSIGKDRFPRSFTFSSHRRANRFSVVKESHCSIAPAICNSHRLRSLLWHFDFSASSVVWSSWWVDLLDDRFASIFVFSSARRRTTSIDDQRAKSDTRVPLPSGVFVEIIFCVFRICFECTIE